jgi:hypothetical protein
MMSLPPLPQRVPSLLALGFSRADSVVSSGDIKSKRATITEQLKQSPLRLKQWQPWKVSWTFCAMMEAQVGFLMGTELEMGKMGCKAVMGDHKVVNSQKKRMQGTWPKLEGLNRLDCCWKH